MIKGFVAMAAAASLCAPAFADGGDPFRGKAYAGSMCASCHAISADDAASPVPAATPFRAMKLEHPTAEAFTAWMNTQHPVTHAGILKERQAEDIWALIASLRPATSQ